jgi:CheY-like chemotaxis protein
LKRRGYNVTAYTSSLTALEEFRQNPSAFDIVVTDQTMPGMTGGMLAAELLKIRRDIPIAICTGYSELINKEQAKEIGIREYLMKPFDITQLEKVIHKLVSGKKEGVLD